MSDSENNFSANFADLPNQQSQDQPKIPEQSLTRKAVAKPERVQLPNFRWLNEADRYFANKAQRGLAQQRTINEINGILIYAKNNELKRQNLTQANQTKKLAGKTLLGKKLKANNKSIFPVRHMLQHNFSMSKRAMSNQANKNSFFAAITTQKSNLARKFNNSKKLTT